MFTRNDYLEGKCSHREYYAQFVTETTKSALLAHTTVKALQSSNDKKNLSDFSLVFWDSLHLPYGTITKMKEAGDCYSMASNVCIFKEAARQILEENPLQD
jgi:hypothetical protein